MLFIVVVIGVASEDNHIMKSAYAKSLFPVLFSVYYVHIYMIDYAINRIPFSSLKILNG